MLVISVEQKKGKKRDKQMRIMLKMELKIILISGYKLKL